MADKILPQDESRRQNWEEECYQEGCALAREKAIQRLKEIDEDLFRRLVKKIVSI